MNNRAATAVCSPHMREGSVSVERHKDHMLTKFSLTLTDNKMKRLDPLQQRQFSLTNEPGLISGGGGHSLIVGCDTNGRFK